MKLIKLAAAIAALSAGSAFAIPAFEIPGGSTLDPFGGIDWAGNGTVYTTNFDQAAANAGTPFNFTSTFFAYANPGSGIQRPNGTQFFVQNLRGGEASTGTDLFELTTVARINETGICTNNGQNCTFTVTGGTFDIYLDTNIDTRNGDDARLAQFENGTRIIGGAITGGVSSFASTDGGQGGSGQVDLRGIVDFTNNAFINPNLVGTTAVATLQTGTSVTNYARPTGIVGASNSCTSSSDCTLAFQADANQSFAVPLPGTLALMGVAMAGLGITTRRRARG